MPHRKILLVEDNPDDVVLTMRALRRNNIVNEVIHAADGAQALDWLFSRGPHAERGSELPALVLLDLKLPRVDGTEVLKEIRADPRTRLLHVIVLTTSREDEDVLKSYNLGANSYIRKPVDFDEFIRVVGQIGLYWLVLNEPLPQRPAS